MATQQTLDQHFKRTKLKSHIVKSFYKKKDISPLKEQLDYNAKTKEVFTPTVKKLISFSSDESDSDSDFENYLSYKRSIPNTEESENYAVSPPKIKKMEFKHKTLSKVVTPSTPKQKSNCRVKVKTPYTQLTEFELSPEKSTCSSRKLLADKYQEARLALHSSVPDNLVGRENEMNQLLAFITDHVKNKTSGSLYISGPPGTGKTAALTKITKDMPKNVNQIYINCTSLKAPNVIYGKISEELKIQANKKDLKAAIEKYFKNSSGRRKTILLILDEVDNLESKNQSVLYTIFEWPSILKAKLILIGIANALDLTDRILPRLQTRCEVKPEVMHFAPYSNEQIISIIMDRLQQANVIEIFTHNALNLLSRKISAISGDIRKTLDICRRLFEFAEIQRNMSVLQPTNGIKTDNINEIVKVDVKEVLAILNQVYGGSQNIDEAEDKFPLQQKLLLCSLMLLLNKGRNKDVTISRLYVVYKKVCLKRNLNIVDNSEFVSLCSLIETRGIIRVISKKDAQLSKILLEWDQDQLNAALIDKNLTSDIINDVSCL